MQTPAGPAPVPGNVTVVLEDDFVTFSGRKVKVHTLQVDGLFNIVTAVGDVGIIPVPQRLTYGNFMTRDQRAQVAGFDDQMNAAFVALEAIKTGPETEEKKGEVEKVQIGIATIFANRQRLLNQWNDEAPYDVVTAIADSVRAQIAAIMHYAMGSKRLLTALVAGVSDVKESEVVALLPVDALQILNKAVALIPLEATVEAALGFSKLISGLTGAYKNASKKFDREPPDAAPQT